MRESVMEYMHKQWAGNYLTGITENNLVDIIEGKWNVLGVNLPVKVEFYMLKPYYCYGNKKLCITESKDLAEEWKTKNHKVRYVDNKYSVRFHFENMGNNGAYFWQEVRQGNEIKLSDEHKAQIREKLKRLNKNV